MRIAFPVEKDCGLESVVFGHFGSAPLFLVCDAESGALEAVRNRDEHHAHGACNPTRALGGRQVDAVVVGGIGAGALAGLARMGVVVHRAAASTVAGNLALLASGALAVMAPRDCCGGHGGGGGCAHGPG
jgi:predicted Fe-Mo cluster-binding NifX family protein